MEKKTRTIGILLLVLLVLLITFFGLKKWNTSKSEAEEKKKENAVVHIFGKKCSLLMRMIPGSMRRTPRSH